MASPIKPFAELNVIKTRERSNTASLLPISFNPNDDGIPEVPIPETKAKFYTKERLQKSLVYAEKFLKQQNISPRSELFINYYKQTIKDALTAETTAEREDHIIEVLVEEKIIQLEGFLKPLKTAEQAELEDHLLQLREMQYLTRYGDYLKVIPVRIRNHANTQQIPDWQLTSTNHQWTEIADAIIKEEERRKEADRLGSKMKDEGLPTTMTIVFACRDLGLSEGTVIWSIKDYATRNRQLHRSIDNMKEQGNFTQVAETLFADRNDLDSVFSFKSATDIEHLRKIVQAEIDHCFVNAHKFPDAPGVWAASEALFKVYEDAQEKAKKPTKDEVKKANIAASEEKSEEASKGSSSSAGTKRVASTAEPRGSEREEGGTKRRQIEFLAQQTKLEGQLEYIKRELARMDEEYLQLNE
ncbi:hypothetical protein MMC06_003040 [Schaereria dolodes]|nr:hypothetical protein [Schaereria dolodes]